MEGKRMVVNIPVTTEDGTTKTYINNQRTSDNVNLLSVKQKEKAASCTSKPIQGTVNKNATSFELYVIQEDQKAKVQMTIIQK